MRANTQEIEAQQDLRQLGGCETVGKLVYHYSFKSLYPPEGLSIMWAHDDSVTVGREATGAKLYARVDFITA